MKYDNLKHEFVEESEWDRIPKLSLGQLLHLVRLATVEVQLSGKPFVFTMYDELFNFNRKESIHFLMTGVGDDFFNLTTEDDRNTILSLVGKYYCNKWRA